MRQSFFHVGLGELDTALQQELAIGAQHQDFTPFEARALTPDVEPVIDDMPLEDPRKTGMEWLAHILHVNPRAAA